jgi:hypothetical protein
VRKRRMTKEWAYHVDRSYRRSIAKYVIILTINNIAFLEQWGALNSVLLNNFVSTVTKNK